MASVRALPPRSVGLPEKLADTWDALLPRDPRVLVPVHVDLLLVREPIPRADTRFRLGVEDSRAALPPPFTTVEDRPRGAHLFWAVPDALATANATETSLDATALPDRWLVVRVHQTPAGAALKAWVLDARAGTATPLDQWSSTLPTGKPFTSIGAGDAGFIGYADNVVNRLSFHDDLRDVTSSKLAYLVCGWYAAPGEDPLASHSASRSAAGFDARLATLRWSLSQDDLDRAHAIAHKNSTRAASAGLSSPKAGLSADGVVHSRKPTPILAKRPVGGLKLGTTVGPTACLFHGSVVGASWPRGGGLDAPPRPSQIRVALGRTPFDAFATLIGDETELLTAFALGATGDLDSPDGRALLADRLHDAAFAARSGGFETFTRAPRVQTKIPPIVLPGSGRLLPAMTIERTIAVDLKALIREEKPEPSRLELPKARRFLPAEPALAVMGVGRSLRYGGDGDFMPDGTLACRLGASTVKQLRVAVDADTRVTVLPTDVLASTLDHGGIPDECEALLGELICLDPGLAEPLAAKAAGRLGRSLTPGLAERVEVEQTAWWAIRRRDSDAAGLLAHSGLDGTLPSPVAVQVALDPWVPMHLDWEVEYVDVPHTAWTLGETELSTSGQPGATTRAPLRGRALLSGGAADALAQSMRLAAEKARASDTSAAEATGTAAAAANLLDDADPDADALDELATRLSRVDLLSGSLEHLHLLLRGEVRPDPASPPPAAPPGFVALRSGYLRLTRLRLVDAYGRFVDLDLGERPAALPADLAVPGAPNVYPLPPRFTAPTRLQFRFADAVTRTLDATDERPPVVGWLLPDHLDEALEVFEADGTPKGQLRVMPDGSTAWEIAPGRYEAVGASPAEVISHPALASFVTTMFDQGRRDAAAARETALSALLRVVDTTRWTVDPFGQVGEEHLALLLGHPIVVVAATLRLEVDEPVALSPAADARVPVRLGSLSHWKDGLLAFIVDDDMKRVRVAGPAAERAQAIPATSGEEAPVDHPVFDRSQTLWVVPNHTYRLLLFLEPHTVVHATTGLLPRKELGLRKEWTKPALGVLAPTFRFGPVLRDPGQIRMPIPADLGGAWTWTHRADVDRWADEETVVHTSGEAIFPSAPAVVQEGWLRFTPDPEEG